ncbi:MAG: methylated-DNA--[protein]-cysteine S-methyltransferase [Thermodesulfobacteriota bacterium]
MKQIKVFSLDTPIGAVQAACGPAGLVALSIRGDQGHFGRLVARRAPGAELRQVSPRSQPAGRQLAAYFAGRAPVLDAAVDLSGLTPFTQKVLLACRAIPYGQTATYGALARRAGSPRAARAVGQVMHNNPVPIFIPCHRVLGSDGSLTGFGGGLPLKEYLLALEAGRK